MDQKISQLNILTTAAQDDVYAIVDVSASETKKITQDHLEDTISNSTNFIDVLTANTTFITKINTIAPSPLTTKGDLFTFDTVPARLPVGTNGNILIADSSQTTGLRWGASAGGGGGGGGTKIAINTTEVSTNSAAFQTAFSLNIPANTLGTNDAIRFIIAYTQGAGAGTGEIKASYGGQTLGTLSPGSTEFTPVYGYIIADGTTGAQKSQFFNQTLLNSEFTNALTVNSTIDQTLLIEIRNTSGAGALIGVESIIVEKITDEGSGIRTKTINISSAEILNLNTTSIELVPAPGAGKVSLVNSVVFSLDAGTQYVNGSTQTVQYVGDNVNLVNQGNNNILSATDFVWSLLPLSSGNGTERALTAGINAAVELSTPTAFITGTGTLKVFITYQIVTI